uniref:Uncharacterized protein n=1 Tax=Prorocentrum micans TaxID=2945 RepID=A0A7S2X5U0_PROMC|mmetsp:Transcript_6747/g.5399  ORF Transcript_6747/g.5399 Transcript_6747/m.5399 type:complete len:112 (+) Transcript_6747:2-337(+)
MLLNPAHPSCNCGGVRAGIITLRMAGVRLLAAAFVGKKKKKKKNTVMPLRSERSVAILAQEYGSSCSAADRGVRRRRCSSIRRIPHATAAGSARASSPCGWPECAFLLPRL